MVYSGLLRRKILKRTLLVIVALGVTNQAYNWATKEYGNAGALNYFISKDAYEFEYEVNTPSCKILKMSPWDAAILPFIEAKITPPDCSKRNNGKHWTYVLESKIHINQTAVVADGYSMSSVKCCYKGILRVEETLDKYTWDADNQVRYTEDCIQMGEVTKLHYEFVRVFCKSTSWPYLGEVVYRDYFAVPMLTKERSLHKLNYWESRTKNKLENLPPSIVMIGIDSLSRMNYHRSFPQTIEYLKKIDAVEMLGYTKVGENTMPNTGAFLSGYDPSEMQEGCMRKPDTPQDLCHYIWKHFHENNYLTATVEDAPGLVGFNYLKLGFVEQPTDFYFRPFMLAVHKSLPRVDYYHTDCIGHFTTEETLLNYIQGIMSLSNRVPVFVHSWMTSLAHLDINGAKFADKTVAEFLANANLSNTILIFLSDHGQRYGAIRETLAGWYEDKLPILTIYLPPTVRSAFPGWQTALKENAARLSSPFDLYKTMEHVLETSSNYFTSTPRKYGQSLFTPISTFRRCEDAGIKVNYCACLPPKSVDASDALLVSAAEEAVKYLNKVVPSQCAHMTLDRVIAGAVMANDNNDSEGTYLVTFYTNPGQFMFEATVDFTTVENVRTFNVTTDLLRMNKIVRPAKCVDTSLLERYCYCK